MLHSQILEADGTLLGAVITEADNATRRFYAVHHSVRAFHDCRISGSDLAQDIVRHFRHGGQRSAALVATPR